MTKPRSKFIIIVACVLALIGFVTFTRPPRDDTDAPGKRSGLNLYTDNKTGCQYLSAPFGRALTPRLDANGQQICGADN